jgi:hypothetical protein
MRKRSTISLFVAILALASCDRAGASRAADAARSPSPSTDAGGSDTGRSSPEVATMKLRLITKDAVLMATLDDNAATRDFVSLLPLNLTLRDYAGTEKVSDLPRRLSTSGTPPGVDPELGDLTYYAPWGNLAIFYRDFGYSSGLVKLGRIDSGIEKLANARGELTVRLELAEQAP